MPDLKVQLNWMARAIELAGKGEGLVEPNPMVGCVLVKDDVEVGAGYHEKFGGPHAEINALQNADPDAVAGCTAYVTLEPCSHTGKTGPCCEALIEAGVAKVVIGQTDPYPDVCGNGIRRLKEAGIEVETDVAVPECESLNAPYLKRVRTGTPWIIGKWAMTLDGKIATEDGDSRWITNSDSRQLVQRTRGRVDAVMIGANTMLSDDPMLNARPNDPGEIKRIATRIVMDSELRSPLTSKLVRSARDYPLMIVCAPNANPVYIQALRAVGCEIWQGSSPDRNQRLQELLVELGRRGMTNVLCEGGSALLGSLHDLSLIDEVHLYLGPRIFGSKGAPTPVSGKGVKKVGLASSYELCDWEAVDNDLMAVYRKR